MFNVVGKPVLKVDVAQKALGTAVYAADINLPNMLYAKVFRSPIPHGIVRSIDVSAAAALKGVEVIVTREDIPGTNGYGIILKDEPALVGVGERIRRIGEPIVAVAAETLEIAEQAIELIKVDIEELEPIVTIEQAIAHDAVKLHDPKPNDIGGAKIKKGNVEEGFKQCEYIVESYYKTPVVDHSAIEPDAGVAQYIDDVMTVWCSTQNVHYDQRDVARLLNMPLHKVRVIQSTTGGGFGGKLDVTVQAQLCLLAYKTRRPVKMVMTREEYYTCTGKRHPYCVNVKTGMSKEGKLLAHELTIYADTGAYTSYGPAVLTRAATHCGGPYEIPNISAVTHTVYTNNPTSCAMRGFGVPQMTYMMESQMDKLAAVSGISPYELRLKNVYHIGSVTPTGQVLKESVGIQETLEKAKKKADEVMKKPENLPPSKRYGRGIACMNYGCGNTAVPNPAGAFIDFYQDGTAILLVGCADIGQGSDTVMAQIAAEELGVRAEDIKTISADTGRTPDGGATSASRQTFITGNAVLLAAQEASKDIRRIAAEKFGVDPSEIILANRKVYAAGKEDQAEPIEAIIGVCRGKGILTQGSGWFTPVTTSLDPVTGSGIPYQQYAFATQIADVIVDVETGELRVLNIVAAHDVGQAINPVNVVAQIEGGCGMGLGYGTCEEMVVERGQVMNNNFSTYVIPTDLDMPKVHTILVECPDSSGPFGAKGVGEATLIPTAAAVANAVHNAIGIQFNSLPLSAEKIFGALNAK